MDASIKFQAKDFITSRRLGEKSGLWEHYRLGRFLGEGAYGAVHSCIHLETGAERACKIMEKTLDNDEITEEALKEYHILKEMDHPNMMSCYEVLEDDTAFYIITDLCEGGDLLDELEKYDGGALPEDDVVVLMGHLLSCINYMHQHGLAHRDLKLENVLLHDSDYDTMKVIDFGLAARFDSDTRFNDIVGTAYYLAPETLDHSSGPKVDCWSAGIIAYMLLGGYAPFDGEDDREVLQSVVSGCLQFNEEVWDDVSEEAIDFIAKLLEKDEEKRVTAEEALQHPWLKSHRRSALARNHNRRASTRASLVDLQKFQSQGCILKQATCAMMASQFQHSEEVKDISRAFQTLDQTGCGKLTKADLQACLAVMLEDDPDASEHIDVDGLFEQVNFSGTNTIMYSEFVGACLLQKKVLDDVKLQQVFQTYDKEEKGYITRRDLKEALSRNCLISDRTIDKIMRQTDKSGHGHIYFEDFRAKMLGHSVSLPPKIGSTDCDQHHRFRLQAPQRTRAPVQIHAKGA
ncbi:activated protein kinase catalytic subunit alpha-1 [Seminavis robusta]|uniref:non-specific serine/threonine protein kinase n=1 Tax=Seminavis robusta TaxID=568900 RepID=A0A9N8HF92_9STRA|nr:activated protein kinase catalytic subunit alpha-1 [Seminavis robusta]|eukprot:Sro338_g120890.1 activated protein kinase catalytic subunit alpha-1 (518) ;mRNA; r:50161-51809